MSIQVNNLTKIYGTQRAVNNISFEAKQGEILGFLGPNGAGKTTTMKIITCFLPPDEGTVSVCGYDILTNSTAVRQCIGYLPEHNPLYLDMYVREYLAFVAGLHRMPKPTDRIKQMIALTGLEREQNKKIQQLSKGYRQRVGLAQAMLHDPQVLILDEPTSGLDPNQLAEVRTLIKAIGREKTVVFSTHIMQEVQALCDRVVIINQGQIVADNTIEEITHQQTNNNNNSRRITVLVEFTSPVDSRLLSQIDHVQEVIHMGDYCWQLLADEQYDIRPQIFNFAVRNNLTVITLQRESQSLEDIFRQLTQ